MYDLLSYKDARINALTKELDKQKEISDKYATWLFELFDKDCPEDYKRIIKQELVNEGAGD